MLCRLAPLHSARQQPPLPLLPRAGPRWGGGGAQLNDAVIVSGACAVIARTPCLTSPSMASTPSCGPQTGCGRPRASAVCPTCVRKIESFRPLMRVEKRLSFIFTATCVRRVRASCGAESDDQFGRRGAPSGGASSSASRPAHVTLSVAPKRGSSAAVRHILGRAQIHAPTPPLRRQASKSQPPAPVPHAL